MKFIVNNGPFLKNNNTSEKIHLNLLISLLPIIIYKTIITNYLSILIFSIISIISIGLLILIDIIIKNKQYKFNITDYLYQIVILFIMYLFIINVNFSNILYIGILILIVLIISKFIKNINAVSLFLIIHYIILNNSINIKYNVYILGILITVIILYLILTKSIKFRVLLTFLIIGIISMFSKDIDLPIILIFGTYVIPYIYSTPLHAFTQYLYGIILGILLILFGIKINIILVFLLSFVIKYIDLYFGIYMSKKKSC